MALSKLFVLGVFMLAPVSAWAQQSHTDGPDFDPVTRALSDKNPPVIDPSQAGQPPAPPPLTPEQQAEIQRQKQLADIAAKREEAKKKYAEAEKLRKEKQEMNRQAEKQKQAAIRASREARIEQQKQNREQLEALLKEQKDARKAYQEAKKTATGSTVQQIETDYMKSEKDRAKKIKELRHPSYKKLTPSTLGSGTTPQTGTIALPGSVTSGSGSTVTQH